MARIADAREADYHDHEELVAAIRTGRGWIPNIFRTMLHSPPATEGWVTLGNVVRLSSSLDTRTRELVILLVAHLHESRYEWQHHVGVARRIGITEAEIAAVSAWPSAGWDQFDLAVLTFAAATATREEVPQWCLEVVVGARGNRYVVDLAVTTAYYVAVAHFAHALSIDPETTAPATEQP